MYIYALGSGAFGQLGLGQQARMAETGRLALKPAAVEIPPDAFQSSHSEEEAEVERQEGGQEKAVDSDVKVQKVYCGQFHSAALLSNGSVIMSGRGKGGRLGLGNALDSEDLQLVQLPGPVAQLALGAEHTVALLENGDLYSFGEGFGGQLGIGDLLFRLRPEKMRFFKALQEKVTVEKVACGWEASGCITHDGRLWTWGSGSRGVLGHGDTSDCLIPTEVECGDSVKEKFVELAISLNHAVALTESGRAFSWGTGHHGELGLGPKRAVMYTPTAVTHIGGQQCVKVALGLMHSVVITSEGKLWGWGMSRDGQLGIEAKEREIAMPRMLMENFPTITISEVVCGPHYTACVSDQGGLFTFGLSQCGQLGHMRTDTQVDPALVQSFVGYKVTDLAAGGDHMWVVTEDEVVVSDDEDQELVPQGINRRTSLADFAANIGEDGAPITGALSLEELGQTRCNTSGCASILVPTPRHLEDIKTQELTKQSQLTPRAIRSSGLYAYNADNLESPPGVLQFQAWFTEKRMRQYMNVEFFPAESIFRCSVTDQDQSYTLAVRNRQGYLLQEWDLHVGAVIDILGRPTTLMAADGPTTAWIDFQARKLTKQQKNLEKSLAKYCVFRYTMPKATSLKDERNKDPNVLAGGKVNLRKLMEKVEALEEQMSKYRPRREQPQESTLVE